MISRLAKRGFARAWALAIVSIVSLAPASAQETTTYTYDQRGRVVNVNHGSTGPNAGAATAYTYDKADNRTQAVVTGGTGGTVTLTLTPATLPNGSVGTAYSQTITASGGTAPYSFSQSGLPSWLSLNSTSGVLSGTPTAAGTSPSFTISASDGAGDNGSKSYTVTVTGGTTTLTLAPATLPGATVGVSYSRTITASGGTAPYTFTGSGLPAWLSLTSAGVLSGTPTSAGTTPSFTITANDGAGDTGSQAYSITINQPGTITLSPTTLPDAQTNTRYNQSLTASGGSGGYQFSVVSGALPSGISLVNSGVGESLSGTPTTAGTYNFTIGVTDHSGSSGTQAYTLVVN